MDKRTIIAFVLAFLIIFLYPQYLKKMYPQKAQAQLQTKTQTLVEANDTLKEPSPKVSEITVPNDIPEKEVVVTTDLVSITFSSYEGTIKSIKLLQYKDKKDNPIELARPVAVGYRPFASTLPQSSLAYEISQEGNNVICVSTADGVKITKTYTINPESYGIEMMLSLTNISDKEVVIPSYSINAGTVFPGDETQAVSFVNGISLIDDKPAKFKLGKPGFRTSKPGKVFWCGISNKYFALILKPKTSGQMATVGGYEQNSIQGITGKVTMPEITLPPKSGTEESFTLFAGPKKYEILKGMGMRMDEIMDFGMFGAISKGLLYILNLFYKFIHNYGVAIILLTILVRIILYPLTLKSYKSMGEMQKIQPHIQELQKKYKDDPKRMQKEMMALYKEHKVNPFSSCLPMLLQMPVLIALFATLRSAIELRGAPFMLWITDLSEPESIFHLSNGFGLHVLPILLIALFFIQQKTTAMPAMNPEQAQQQKMMANIMPIFMGFIFYSMPSGLNLYFGLSTLLGIWDQYRIKKSLA